jgi:hypothetical protein
MESVSTAPSAQQLNGIAVNKIIGNAVFLVRVMDWDKHKAYEVGKAAIRDFTLTPDEYQQAIRELAEALGV